MTALASQTATGGYRAERAQTVGPLRLELSCEGGMGNEVCAAPVTAIYSGLTELTAQCRRHLRVGAQPVEAMAKKIAARLELGYGVTVETDKEESWT